MNKFTKSKMQTFAAFSEGYQCGGQKSIKMVQLKAMMEDLGFEEVQTCIQSGIYSSKARKRRESCE
ncbi:MAG: DUF1697 domain-containing protein [Saprospiraceae bacterium]|nr:DUF1697 domain-containing protein [Candidatus Brachybacter algidus]MBK8749222.1 DUF1697 domain-containing protein [Candidatus Brachybacter algidus]